MTPAIASALADIAKLLRDTSASYAVIGGMAIAVRGESRQTADIDLVLGTDVAGGLELLRLLPESLFTPLFPDADQLLIQALVLPIKHKQTGIRVDIALGLSGFEAQAIRGATTEDLFGTPMPVVTAEDLLVMKAVAGRPRDWEDAAGIASRHGAGLDWDSVMRSARELEQAVERDLTGPLTALRWR